MPRVVVMLKPGRTRAQQAMLMQKVTDAVAESLQIAAGEVTVVLAELHDHLVARDRHFLTDGIGSDYRE